MSSCFPGWTSYIISISTAGTIGLWYVERQKGMSLGRCSVILHKRRGKLGKEKVKQGPDVKGMLRLKYWTGCGRNRFLKLEGSLPASASGETG